MTVQSDELRELRAAVRGFLDKESPEATVARSASWALARGLDEGDPEVSLLAGIARVVCSQTYLRCASDAVQVHGGIRYTWEHPVQLHVKRSRSGAVLLGTVAEQRRVVADLVPALAVRA